MSKARRMLIKLGMEKEFDNWVKAGPIQLRTLEIGTKVRFVGSGDTYLYSRDDSEGTISAKSHVENRIYVSFYKVSEVYEGPSRWSIQKKHLEII